MARRVHQILATLGYGDAIGHEVLGIARALRAAGFDSEIIVEAADPRLEDLTVDYRDMIDEITDDDLLIHHFPPGWRSFTTTSRRPSTSWACTISSCGSAFMDAGSCWRTDRASISRSAILN